MRPIRPFAAAAPARGALPDGEIRGRREWRRSNESADCIINTLPQSRWTRVRYEDLCAQPRRVMEGLCRFLELDPDRINLDFRSKPQHVVGNGMRMEKLETGDSPG